MVKKVAHRYIPRDMDKPAKESHQQKRDRVQREIAEFEARGGIIEVVSIEDKEAERIKANSTSQFCAIVPHPPMGYQ